MSLTSYRAAPPRGGFGVARRADPFRASAAGRGDASRWGLSGLCPGLATTRSPTLRRAVPWARRGFTAEFGMGSGGARTLWSPSRDKGQSGRGRDRAQSQTRRRRSERVRSWSRPGVVKLVGHGSRGRSSGRAQKAITPGRAASFLISDPLFSVLWSAAPGARRALGAGRRRAWFRAIRTGQLHALPRFHSRPIDVVVDHGSRRDLVWRRVSRLDAFSGYPDRT